MLTEGLKLFPTVVVRDAGFVAEPTFYSRHGDVFAWGCLGAAVALSGAALRAARDR